MNGPRMRGFLLKRNAEHRKANLIGSKYKRRWVELTGPTLVYAATQQDLLAGKVFAMREMRWVKTDGDTKFQVRFPERVLTFKVETGGSTERDTWVEALEQAKEMGAEAGRRGGSAEKLEQLKKTAEDMLLEHSNDGSRGIAAYAGLPVSSAGGAAARSHALAAGPPSVSSSRSTETGQRPPSPRSLLASAKAGSMFVTSTTPASVSVAPAASTHSGTYYEQQDSEPDDADDHIDDDEEANCGHIPACVRQGSLERAAQRYDRDGSGCSTGSGSMHHPAAAAEAATDHNSPAAPSSSTPRSKWESLQRRLTPGVMLINTSPSTPTAVDPVQLDPASSIEQPSPACSSHGSPNSCIPSRHAQQQQQRACRSPVHSPACQHDSSSDEILTLDPDELTADSSTNNYSTASRSPSSIAALASGSSGSASGGTRPGTAPSYRPGTPLKPCLRGGGSSNSSSGGLPYVGSASTPASGAEAAAAAAAALASLGLQQRQHGAPSPLSGRAAVGQQVLAGRHGDGAGDSKVWVEADWDESSEDVDEPSPSNKATRGLSGGVDVIGTAAPVMCSPGAPLVVKGVKADNNWLDDDFDS